MIIINDGCGDGGDDECCFDIDDNVGWCRGDNYDDYGHVADGSGSGGDKPWLTVKHSGQFVSSIVCPGIVPKTCFRVWLCRHACTTVTTTILIAIITAIPTSIIMITFIAFIAITSIIGSIINHGGVDGVGDDDDSESYDDGGGGGG
jgi:hypothetical protein